MTLDAMHMAVYEWDVIEPAQRIDDPVVGTLPGIGAPDAVPGNPAPNMPSFLPPSPAYGNQRTR
jgi:hypothetical protein